MPSSTIKAVIFDLNGVIIQHEWPHAEQGMIDIVKGLKDMGLKTAVLSNLWIGNATDARESDWAQHFDVMGLSGEINASKPDRESYEAVLEKLALQPEEVLFVDDLPGHIAGARAVGLHTHLFRHENELRKELESRHLL